MTTLDHANTISEIEFDYLTTQAVADLFGWQGWRRHWIVGKAWVRRWLELREVAAPASDLVKFRIRTFQYAPIYECVELSWFRNPTTGTGSWVVSSFYGEDGSFVAFPDEHVNINPDEK